jgi:hypothetical protein
MAPPGRLRSRSRPVFDGAAGKPPGLPPHFERMSAKFPTAAIAVLDFSGPWSELAPGRARLNTFVIPHDRDMHPVGHPARNAAPKKGHSE